MNKTFRLTAIFLFVVPLTVWSQFVDGKFMFPDIPGYYTLKCDFHMHTVFSDGTVWPTVRVREAVNEGLDAIAITEHLEYWSHKNYLNADHNTSYDIAKPYADKNGLILIKACEITKGMPPGHFNFLFIEDANTIDSVDWKKAIMQANEQGAFVFWNHPGWRMENTIPVWYKEHSWLLSQGLIHGIEVVNENEYYPLAQQWCIDSSLTMLGNSDIHDPVDYFYDKTQGEHRPITLVFAKEKTEEGIREALDNGRTAIFYQNSLIGDQDYLESLFLYSTDMVIDDSEGELLLLANHFPMEIDLVLLDSHQNELCSYNIAAGEIGKLLLPEGESAWLLVKNCISGNKEYLTIELGLVDE